MSEEQFWRCTLRKLLTLRDMHFQINNSSNYEDDEWGGTSRGYIDELW